MYSITSDEGPQQQQPQAQRSNGTPSGGATANPFAALPLPLPTSHNATDLSEKPIR